MSAARKAQTAGRSPHGKKRPPAGGRFFELQGLLRLRLVGKPKQIIGCYAVKTRQRDQMVRRNFAGAGFPPAVLLLGRAKDGCDLLLHHIVIVAQVAQPAIAIHSSPPVSLVRP